MTDLRHVQQEDTWGCAIATIAMLTDRTYADIKAEIDDGDGHGHNGDWSQHGVASITVDRLLMARGFFFQRRYSSWYPAGPWPPEPFAPLHYAQVVQPSGNAHFVAMGPHGEVYDPMREGLFHLTDWPGVNNVVGLLRPEGASR